MIFDLDATRQTQTRFPCQATGISNWQQDRLFVSCKIDWPSPQPFVGCKDQDQDQQSRVLNVDMEETSSRLASSLGFDIQAATLTD